MATAIDYTNWTLNPEEARETSDLVFESLFATPNSLAELHEVMTGVDMDKFIPILGQFEEVGLKDPGDCTTNAIGDIPSSEKKWIIELISGRLTMCEAEVPELIKVWKRAMVANKLWEEIDNEKMAFITERLVNVILRSILRLSSFGSTTASNYLAGSGDENITVGLSPALFTPIDGLWKQVYTDQAGAALISRTTIAENALATYALQLDLADDAAKDAFQGMYEGIAPEAMDKNLAIQCTRTLFLNYMSTLEATQQAFSIEKLESGQRALTYRGLQVIERPDWDRIIQKYFDSGVVYENPHRAVLTYKENIPIGTSDEQSMSEVDSFYDKTDKKHYTDFAYRIDMKILLEAEIAVAY